MASAASLRIAAEPVMKYAPILRKTIPMAMPNDHDIARHNRDSLAPPRLASMFSIATLCRLFHPDLKLPLQQPTNADHVDGRSPSPITEPVFTRAVPSYSILHSNLH